MFTVTPHITIFALSVALLRRDGATVPLLYPLAIPCFLLGCRYSYSGVRNITFRLFAVRVVRTI